VPVGKQAEIIPVEPDPADTGERECFSSSIHFQRLKKERTMQIILNGEPHPLEGDYTLLALLENLDVEKEHTALMLNGAVIPATDWHEHPLKEADEVEIMVFVGGG
jgi:thiamine biosynthesis protein ThiS